MFIPIWLIIVLGVVFIVLLFGGIAKAYQDGQIDGIIRGRACGQDVEGEDF